MTKCFRLIAVTFTPQGCSQPTLCASWAFSKLVEVMSWHNRRHRSAQRKHILTFSLCTHSWSITTATAFARQRRNSKCPWSLPAAELLSSKQPLVFPGWWTVPLHDSKAQYSWETPATSVPFAVCSFTLWVNGSFVIDFRSVRFEALIPQWPRSTVTAWMQPGAFETLILGMYQGD